MCEFCEKIYTQEEYQELFDESWYDWMGTFLIKQPDNTINIYVAFDDWFYNTNAVHNIKYCPCCGRELS